MRESTSTQRVIAGAIALAFVLVAAIGATVKLQTPPRPVPASAPDTEFSAERAMTLIEEFAQIPHPIGTLENERVQFVLMEALEELGYEVFRQGEPIIQGDTISRARNIYARLEGTDSTGAILMMAHFDSVPYGPGAADDGSGVAAIVETARVLRNSEPLRNDVIFLLTDGEEDGLLGPRTFLQHNPWRDDLKLVINFEARGTYGPAMMYLTYPGNEFIMRNFIEGASHPVTSSVMFDFAGALPTSSDYYVMKREGIPGFDHAYVSGLVNYHTPNDKPEKLSLRSLQHHGTYGVSLTKHFGNVDLTRLLEDADKPVVYFNTLGHRMVWYRAVWIWPISLAALGLSLIAIAIGLRRGRITVGGMLAGLGTLVLATVATSLLAAVPVYLGISRFGPYTIYNQSWYTLGNYALLFAVFGLVYAVAFRLVRAESLAAGALLFLLPLLILGTIYLPMGSFVLAWPILAVALSLLLLFVLPDLESPWIRLLVGAAGAAPALVLMSPFTFMLIETFTFLMGPAALIMASLVLGLAVMPLAIVGQAPRIGYGMPAVGLAIALVAYTVAVLDTRFTPDRPKMNYLVYGADLDADEGFYFTTDRELDEWTEQFFGDGYERGYLHTFAPFERDEFRIAPAPIANLDVGNIEVVSDEADGDTRRVTLFVTTGHETADFVLYAPPSTPPIHEVLFNGQPWQANERLPQARWMGRFRGRFDEGVTLTFEMDATADAPFALTMVEQWYGVPNIEGIRPRPDWMIPMSNTMPVAWDFSRERIFSSDPLSVLSFRHGSRSTHLYARHSHTFEATAAEESAEEHANDTTEPSPEAV